MHLARTSILLGTLFLSACCFDDLPGGWDSTSGPIQTGPELTGSYRLSVHPGGMSLRGTAAPRPQRPGFGFDLQEIDKDFAQSHALRPFCGLFIQSVDTGRPASNAGIVPGEILVAVDGVEVFYLKTFQHHMRQVKAGDECTLRLVRRGGDGQRELKVRTYGIDDPEGVAEDQVTVVLADGNTPPVFGCQFGTLPAEWTRRVYGDDRPAVLLGALELGSPAYRAGLRPGDRVLRAGGMVVDDAAALRKRLVDWGHDKALVSFQVRGTKGDTFMTDVALHDYQGESGFCAPLLVGVKSNPRVSRVGVGPLHILTNYRKEYEISRTRDPETSGYYSVGWGLFKYRWTPGSWKVRVLWLITFGSD